MSSQGVRLKQIRTALGLSQEAFGKILDVSKQYISNIEADRNILNNEKLDILAVKYNVNLNYLFTGNGEIFINDCENTHAFIKNDKIIENYKNWGKRLGKILSDAEETPIRFAKRTGIKESRIEEFVLDSANPDMEEINAIKSNVDVSLDWLFYGENAERSLQTEDISLSTKEIFQLKQLLKKTNSD